MQDKNHQDASPVSANRDTFNQYDNRVYAPKCTTQCAGSRADRLIDLLFSSRVLLVLIYTFICLAFVDGGPGRAGQINYVAIGFAAVGFIALIGIASATLRK